MTSAKSLSTGLCSSHLSKLNWIFGVGCPSRGLVVIQCSVLGQNMSQNCLKVCSPKNRMPVLRFLISQTNILKENLLLKTPVNFCDYPLL